MLSEMMFYDTMRQGLWASVLISTPILAVALITGLAIGLFQALTSIQEMTLTFVPKLGAIAAVFWLAMGFMTQTLVDYYQNTVIPIVAGG